MAIGVTMMSFVYHNIKDLFGLPKSIFPSVWIILWFHVFIHIKQNINDISLNRIKSVA